MAETKKDALVAFDAFVETWSLKYEKAQIWLLKQGRTLVNTDVDDRSELPNSIKGCLMPTPSEHPIAEFRTAWQFLRA